MANLDRQTYKSSWNPNAAEMVMKWDDDSSTGIAGVYTASVTIPAGAYVSDIIIQSVTQWNAGTEANLVVGDGDDPNGYLEATSMQSVLTTGIHTSILACGAGAAGLGAPGVYIMDSSGTGSGSYSSSARKVIAEITTTGTVASAGETRLVVIWTKPTDSVSSSYAAT